MLVCRYTICIGRAEDRQFLRKLKLKTLVLDEGHMLKNMSTLKYNHLMKIQVRSPHVFHIFYIFSLIVNFKLQKPHCELNADTSTTDCNEHYTRAGGRPGSGFAPDAL